MAATYVLKPVADVVSTLSTPVHPTLFPVPLVPILHAARISLVFRTQKVKAASQLSLGADMAGFLLMCWGGSILTHTLLAMPIPQILSYQPWAIYCGTHLFLTAALDSSLLPFPSPKALDVSLPLIDAILRSAPIVSAVEACRTHPNPAIRGSLFAQYFLGAVSSAGGGVSAGTLGVWEHDWRLHRPQFLNGGGMWATMDLWGGAVAAGVYGLCALSHPWYAQLYEAYGLKPVHLMTPLAARSMAVIVLTFLFAGRAAATHYGNKLTNTQAKADQKKTENKSQ